MKCRDVKCRDCQTTIHPGKLRCPNPKCRAWNVQPALPSLDKYVVRLSDAELSTTERIPTGLCDVVLGGGIARTSVNLLAGEPGAGKTTLCLQLADILTTTFAGKDALYIANEQSAKDINDTAQRLELRNRDRVLIIKAMGGVNFSIRALLTHFKPCFVILDSLSKWAGDDLSLAVIIAGQLKEISELLNAPTIAVNHITKEGDQAGLKKLEHEVDMCAMFDILKGELDEEGKLLPARLSPRRLMSSKNRYGPAPEEQFYKMTATGLVSIELQPIA